MRALDLPERPWIVGHRGARQEAPENTVASILEAVAQKADMVELDLQLTRDGHWVVHHDLRIRVSEERQEWVGRLTLEEVRRCRPIWLRQGERVEYRVSTLAEALAAVPAGLPLNLEIKRHHRGRYPDGLAAALSEALGDRRQVLVSSFDGAVLAEIRQGLPDLPLAPLGGITASWESLLEAARRLDAFSIHLERRLAAGLGRRGLLDEPAATERPILAYTVDRAEDARRLLRHGVAGFFSDRPGGLRRDLEGGR